MHTFYTDELVVYHVFLVENTAKFKFRCGFFASFTLSCFTRI